MTENTATKKTIAQLRELWQKLQNRSFTTREEINKAVKDLNENPTLWTGIGIRNSGDLVGAKEMALKAIA